MRKLYSLLLSVCFVLVVSAQEKMNMDVINKIKKEGTKNSKVMDIAFHLTDVSGPRLTTSPGFMRAANWAKEELTKTAHINLVGTKQKVYAA